MKKKLVERFAGNYSSLKPLQGSSLVSMIFILEVMILVLIPSATWLLPQLNGIVERTGAWYILPDGSKVQGKEAFVNRVREDLDLQESIKNKLNG